MTKTTIKKALLTVAADLALRAAPFIAVLALVALVKAGL